MNLLMMHSPVDLLILWKDQDEQATNALKDLMCPCGNMIIATLAYRCSKVSSFTFVICFVSKVMPYFSSTVLFIYTFWVHWWFHLFDQSCCSGVTFTVCTAIWKALPPTGAFHNCSVWNTELSKIMISYHVKYNIYRYSSWFGIPRIPR